MNSQFEMVAKTFQGLEDVLAEELRDLGAINVEPGRRMVSFEGDMAMLYKANLCCRTALRILKPIYKFTAADHEELYDLIKEFDWTQVLSVERSFAIDVTAYSDEFSHTRYVTYRVKDAIVDYFRDRFDGRRPDVRIENADVHINVHIAGERVTVSLDSSGEPLYKRGYRVAQTEAPINEVLAAGIILKSGWRGDCPLVDPMCGSGTFLIEAALIAKNINPGVYRKNFAFEKWPDFDAELFEELYNDDSREREFNHKIYGGDISPRAIAITNANIKSAGVGRYIDVKVKDLAQWEEAPGEMPGVLVTNPPYGERISVEDMDGLYRTLGQKLKRVFKGYHAWVIGFREEYFQKIGLTPSRKEPMYNGALECQLREYVIFEGDYRTFRAEGGSIKEAHNEAPAREKSERKPNTRWRREPQNKLEERYRPTSPRFTGEKGPHRDRRDRPERPFDRPNDRFRKSDDRFRKSDGPYQRKPFSVKPAEDINPDNPLAKRRNVDALKSIQGKRPSLPPNDNEKPMLRSRRAWRKPDSDPETDK